MSNLQRWFMIIALWAGIIFLIVIFYWFMIRPSRVRKMCSERANIVSEQSKNGFFAMLEINRAVYSDCLRSNGVDR